MKLEGWEETGGTIKKVFTFPDFVAAIKFVNLVAMIAEEVQHHPDIMINYNKITFALSTHEAGGVTDKDWALATKIEELWKK